MQPLQICIGPIIRIGRESWCLPYAGFFFWLRAFRGYTHLEMHTFQHKHELSSILFRLLILVLLLHPSPVHLRSS